MAVRKSSKAGQVLGISGSNPNCRGSEVPHRIRDTHSSSSAAPLKCVWSLRPERLCHERPKGLVAGTLHSPADPHSQSGPPSLARNRTKIPQLDTVVQYKLLSILDKLIRFAPGIRTGAALNWNRHEAWLGFGKTGRTIVLATKAMWTPKVSLS